MTRTLPDPAVLQPVSLSQHTTLRLGGPARDLVVVDEEAQWVRLMREYDAEGRPWVLLGGGSNLVVGDAGVDATVVKVATRGIEVSPDTCGGAWVEVAAGEPWDDLVVLAIESEWVGVEALSGIPGLVGATPVQNVGAYGYDVSSVIARVRVYDRGEARVLTLTTTECDFGYRTSLFKSVRHRDGGPRYVVLAVAFQFTRGTLGAPLTYVELAAAVGGFPGQRLPTAEVRTAVLALRRGKGMVLDDDDPDTWSVGSFFTNPVVDVGASARLPIEAPRWTLPDDPDRFKVSAAWLVERAGFAKGYSLPGDDRISLSHKHTLALTNRGGGTTTGLLRLARSVREGVRERFGIQLEPEPVLLGCSLDD